MSDAEISLVEYRLATNNPKAGTAELPYRHDSREECLEAAVKASENGKYHAKALMEVTMRIELLKIR